MVFHVLGDAMIGVMDKIRNLRRPFDVEIHDHQKIEVVSIGYVARALGRTTWTVKSWQRIGLLPNAPWLLDPEISNLRRRLFPVTFVEALAVIAKRNHLGRRLDRSQWRRFQLDVFDAYDRTVVPLLSATNEVDPADERNSGALTGGPTPI
jgi:hypothetical protein